MNGINQSGLIKITTLSNIGSYLSPLNGLCICEKSVYGLANLCTDRHFARPEKKVLKFLFMLEQSKTFMSDIFVRDSFEIEFLPSLYWSVMVLSNTERTHNNIAHSPTLAKCAHNQNTSASLFSCGVQRNAFIWSFLHTNFIWNHES